MTGWMNDCNNILFLYRAIIMFELCESLKKYPVITDLPLSRVLLYNAKHLPWVLLVPRVSSIAQVTDLSEDDNLKLFREVDFVSRVMKETFKCDRLNVAAIGNKTPQLHVHVICRTENDPYWPETVWQYKCEKLDSDESDARVELLRPKFEKYMRN